MAENGPCFTLQSPFLKLRHWRLSKEEVVGCIQRCTIKGEDMGLLGLQMINFFEKQGWVLGIDLLRTWFLDKHEASIAWEFDEFCFILSFQLDKSIIVIEHHWTTTTPSIPCHFCLAGTSFAQILSSLEYWQLTNDQLGGSSVGLRCSLAWLKTRQAFDKAVALFNYLELWRCEAGGHRKKVRFWIFAFNFTSTSMVLVEF